MKKTFFFMFLLFTIQSWASVTLDINIIHERSSFDIKETVCGFEPNPEKGFMPDENGCYFTKYTQKAPVYGFNFTPRTGDAPQPLRAAYYIQFLGPNIPAQERLHADVTSGGNKLRDITSIFADNTLQGIAVLEAGESVHLYSDEEPSYTYIYIITVIVVVLGVGLIVRRKK